MFGLRLRGELDGATAGGQAVAAGSPAAAGRAVHRTTGEIKLHVATGGFATPFEPDPRFDGAAVVAGSRGSRWADCPEDIGAQLDVVASEPVDVYPEGSGVRPDELDGHAGSPLVGAFYSGTEIGLGEPAGVGPGRWSGQCPHWHGPNTAPTKGPPMSTDISAIAQAFSGHRFTDVYPHLAPHVRWISPGQATTAGRDAVITVCDATARDLADTRVEYLRFVTVAGPESVAVDVIARYDDGDSSIVSSCDIYEFHDDKIVKITSYAVELTESQLDEAGRAG
jgi:limonene-1,2-epoxide hydrolase